MTTPTLFPSLPAENSVFDRLAQRGVVRSIGASIDPATVDRIGSFHDLYPWLKAEAIVALARSGVDPNSDFAKQIGEAGAKAKSDDGFGWHSIGDLVSAGADAAGSALGTVGGVLADAAKPVVRYTALGAQSLYQEAQGVARNVASWDPGGIPVGAAVVGGLTGAALIAAAPVEAGGLAIGAGVAAGVGLGALAASHIEGDATWEPQSTGGIALQDALAGKRVDLGDGWIPHPGKQLQAEQKVRETVTIDGHALTPGRLLAAGIVQPGTEPYNVLSGLTDASLAMSKFDPGGAVLKEIGNVARNSRLFVSAGGLLADRPTILPEKALEWWNGTGGRAVSEAIAGESNPYQIWKNTGKKLPVDVVRNLAQAATPAEVDQIIHPLLGAELTGRFGYSTFHPLANVRLAQMMPGTHIDLASNRVSQADAVLTAERWLKNVKAPQEVIDSTVSKMINAESPAGRYRATADLMDATKQVLVDSYGVDSARATALTKLEETAVEDARKYNLDNVGESVDVPGMYLDGQMHGLPQPHLFAEFTDRAVSLPEPRDIRRLASDFAPLLNHPTVVIPRMTLEFVQDKVWKVATLARGALLTRTMAEAQARMAAGGLDSAFNHPASFIAWAAGRKGATDVLGAAFEKTDEAAVAEGLDAFNKALTREYTARSGSKMLPFWRKVSQADPEFHQSWAGELLQLQSDPIAREVARAADGLDDVKQAFWDGNLSGYRAQMAENAGGLTSREIADRYIESIADRVAVKTGGDAALLDAIGSGKINGAALRKGLRPSKDLISHLEASDVAPEFVKGQVSVANANNIGQKFDAFGSAMFSKLMAEPQNKLVNSPTFKQFYWARVEQLVPAMSEDARVAAMDLARSQGLGDVAERMAKVAAKHPALPNGLPAVAETVSELPHSARKVAQLADEEHTLRRLSDYTDTVYRETSIDNLQQALGRTSNRDMHWATKPELALGQGTNRGVQLEMDTKGVQGFLNTSKPAWKMGYRYDGSAELLARDLSGEKLWDNLRRVEVDAKVADSARYRQQFAMLEDRGFHRIDVGDGRVAFVHPSRVAVTPGQAATTGGLSLEHADAVAKGDALEQNWHLLHKLSERGQFFDAAKLAFPFGDAWSQMLGKWAKIGVNHPQVLRRATQVIQGGQDSGFFYKNAQGEEVFAYPGTGWISEKLFGVRVPFTGRLDGLSMMTDVLPGVGPVVQIPAGALLPDKPSWDFVRETLFPQGEPDTGSGALEAFLPPWVQKMREAGVLAPFGVQRDQGQWNGAVMDVARYLSSTGKYDTSTVDGMNHLLDDARDKAKLVYLLRGAAQFVAPAAPTPEWLSFAKTPGSKSDALHLVVVDKLAQEYHDLQAKDPQNATQTMLDRYGNGIFLLLQGKTAEVTPGSVTKVGADWERDHEGVMRSFPEVGALFAPDGGELDSAAFQRQMDAGNRVRLTPEQSVRLANNRMAGTIYFNAKDKVGQFPNTAQRAWLSDLRDLLIQKYPGFQDPSGIPAKTDTATLVRQVTDAAQDKRLADNPAAIATNLYLAGRAKAVAASQAAGMSDSAFATAKGMTAWRDWLRSLGELVVKAHPEFENIWDRVFSREMVDDTTGQVTNG